MRRVVIPLLVVGLAQWMALGWWYVVDGLTVNVSIGMMFHELLGLEPRFAWDPAQRLLTAMLSVSPGTVFLAVGGYALLRDRLVQLWTEFQRRRHIEAQRREIIATRRPFHELAALQDNQPDLPPKPQPGLRRRTAS